MKKSFFSKVDWLAFWVATFVSFAVYFYTLGPSVGLEDSGELATASAHLGVPHPPGYPFWTLCTWVFCKIFSFVTYMGHPNPAWAVSCCSAFFGALAAGCTAMLICRSARDFISEKFTSSVFVEKGAKWDAYLCFGGGVGGALAFAFSPVEWSQSTIVEIYSLNSLFLMWVFLLSYRWMRKSSDKILWLTAFVFGLGLTNYQVLLFAIVPLAIIICLKNFKMFRDFALYLFPVALTYQVLKIGEMQQANYHMSSDAINKHSGLVSFSSAPSTVAVVVAVAAAVAAVVSLILLARTKYARHARNVFFALGGLSLLTLLFAGIGVFASDVYWGVEGFDFAAGVKGIVPDITAPLVNPRIYLFVAFFVLASVLTAVHAVTVRGSQAGEALFRKLLGISGILAFCAVLVACMFVDQAGGKGYTGVAYDWSSSKFYFYSVILAFLACSLFVKNGLAYSLPVSGFHVALFVLLERGAMNGLVHPSSWWFWWPVVWNFVVLSLAWFVLPYGRSVAFAAFFAQLGVSFYAYMPIVSELRNPPMNWGYPRTWEGFKHAITRGQYEEIKMPEFESLRAFLALIKVQMRHYFSEVKLQFTDYVALLAFLPLACWKAFFTFKGRRIDINALSVAAYVAIVLAVRALFVSMGFFNSRVWQDIDRVLIFLMAFLALFGVGMMAFKQHIYRPALALRHWIERNAKGSRHGVAVFAASVLAVVFAAVLMFSTFRKGGSVFVFLAATTVLALIGFAVFFIRDAVKYFSSAKGRRFSVSFGAGNISQQWLISSGACFFMMTLPLILLAQVKGDIQDGFIQKVKFISSHAMIAMWIGYGLVFAGVLAVKSYARLKSAGPSALRLLSAALAVAMLLGAGLTPVILNYTDEDLVFRFGGSEQNGHTFGWQFGAYQLDGAKAIRAQLEADEEPLPDPDWPAPMEPFSVFFGGTDPGRFVPTYMIYGANFRPDVYLITQNALADDTYMSVQRDLYGDEIWIPSKEDSQKAFEIYVDEVKRGVRKANGDLKTENGRVQVTGALGVMEINGILSKMMFDHDSSRHAFYVEESYAIPWMYPYLSPHGLIMKLNASKTPYSPRTALKDRDFWDWYTRRLLNDPMYRRDFAAQKSFSKLRSAIAGLYRSQGRIQESAHAFREAHLLYPASPEATFRYISEVLLPLEKLDAVKNLLEYTDVLDPNNQRTDRIHKFIEMRNAISEIEEKFKKGTQSYEDAKRLFVAYYYFGRIQEAASLASQILPYLASKKDEESILLAIEVFHAAKKPAELEDACVKYFSLAGDPPVDVLLLYAKLLHSSKRTEKAARYFDMAVAKDIDQSIRVIAAYLDETKSKDFALWIRLSKLFDSLGREMESIERFYVAMTINRDAVIGECRRDMILYRIYEKFTNYIEKNKRK